MSSNPLSKAATPTPSIDPAIAAAPEGTRKEVYKLWVMTQVMFPTAMPLSVAFAFYHGKHNVCVEAINKIIGKMIQPLSLKNYRFASEVMADLAERMDRHIKWKIDVERSREQEVTFDRWRRDAVTFGDSENG